MVILCFVYILAQHGVDFTFYIPANVDSSLLPTIPFSLSHLYQLLTCQNVEKKASNNYTIQTIEQAFMAFNSQQNNL